MRWLDGIIDSMGMSLSMVGLEEEGLCRMQVRGLDFILTAIGKHCGILKRQNMIQFKILKDHSGSLCGLD